MAKRFFLIASIFGFLGVTGGAFGAHALRNELSSDLLKIFEVGIRYQMYHAFALGAAGWALKKYELRQFMMAGWAFVAGVALFSGSLYIVALTGMHWMGMVTPVGGVALLAGWFFMGAGFWRLQ